MIGLRKKYEIQSKWDKIIEMGLIFCTQDISLSWDL